MTNEQELAVLQNKRASSAGTSGKVMAAAFERIAKANGGIVTFDQASQINAKYPSDLAYYFRQAGGKCLTSKARNGQTFWTVQTLPSGVAAYPDAVAARIAELTAKAKPAPTSK
jgi:hypothetical protein